MEKIKENIIILSHKGKYRTFIPTYSPVKRLRYKGVWGTYSGRKKGKIVYLGS